ncbi:50S ribosome-binding GTPase domain-containing protein [Pochonia chlamydosporia 170]|uniref:50S ribosome-binding GTPase domain-containing protein n=1 Tax=Pochonia chlamydosporia 170 TaxID=1380566 RepID=A0A179EZZ9_METCM|nr:50S ribosome-binding GTPase domain-containing protein [Pochonia chlamydosporia 170]OAQ58751.1 50S ribosome-binding GTPase domain-containing protein [Pochonia chlamydosporia 170]
MAEEVDDQENLPFKEADLLNCIDQESFLVTVMGLTGVGKSNLLERLGATSLRTVDGAMVGHRLESHTRTVNFYSLKYRDQHFLFIDTPGFEDGARQNSDILQIIAQHLATSYNHKKYPDSVIYVSKITETRFMGHARKNLDLFEEVCGTDSMEMVTLLTTMWDTAGQVPPTRISDFESREEELITKYWNEMIQQGAKPRRSDNTRDSLLPILDQCIARRAQLQEQGRTHPALQLQTELVEDNRKLIDTSAGSLLAHEFRQTEKRLENHKERLSKYLEEDPQNERLARRIEAVEYEIQENKEAEDRLRYWTIAGISTAFIAALGGLLGLILSAAR